MTKDTSNQEERPIRRAVIAETGRQLLDRLTISQKNVASSDKRKLLNKNNKRNISDRALAASEPAVKKVPKLKVDPDQARTPGVVPKMWTPAEDKLLHQAIRKHGERNWRAIADLVPGRSYIQCLQRWKKALRPGLRKGHWSKEEDATLLKLVERYKPDWDWSLICQSIPGRNAKQCRERWFLNLDPSINRGPWTAEEDEQLLNYVAQLGGRWSLISKHMQGRTENSVKTRFHSLERKEARNRKWSEEEDEKLIQAVLTYGREFDTIDGLFDGRTKGQIKKRFSILTQQKPDLIRNVYAVEEALRQRKTAEAMANAPNSLQNYPSSFVNAAPPFNREIAPQRLTKRQSTFTTETNNLINQNSWLNAVSDNARVTSPVPPVQQVAPVSKLQKSHSARVIEDILKPNQVIEDSSKYETPRIDSTSTSTLQRWPSSNLNFMNSNPGSPFQALNMNASKPSTSIRTMEAFDKLIDETKANGKAVTSQYNPTAMLYNQTTTAALPQEGLLKRQSSSFGLGESLNNQPQYDAFFNANSIQRRPLQRASNSLGSVGLTSYDSTDMKSFVNLL